ncbi:MAG: DUF1631 family protein [Pseudomonadota bacterium]
MATIPTTSGSTQQIALSRRELMDKLVDIVITHANEQLIGVGSRLIAALLDMTNTTSMGPQLTFRRIKSGNLLKENSYAFIQRTSNCIQNTMRGEVADLLGIKRPKSKAVLSLVSMEEMDDKVAFEAVSRPFEMQYATQLATLNVRLGALFNRDILRIGQNPFRPELFLTSLNSAWREVDPDAQGLVAPLLKPAIMFDFAPMYDALCDALVKNGARSEADEKKAKRDAAAAAKAARLKAEAELARQLRKFLGADDSADMGTDIPLIPDLPTTATMPSGGGGWRPSAAQGFESSMAEAMHCEKAARAATLPRAAASAGSHAGFNAGSNTNAGSNAFSHAAPSAELDGDSSPLISAGAIMAALGQAGFGRGPAPLLDMVRTLQASMPGHFGGSAPAAHHLQGSEALHLPRLKASIPQGSLSRGDESTIDLLSKVFETVCLDTNIPPEARQLLQYLQIPVLKAALSDKNFFFEEAHPARRMIDMVSRVGMEARRADDPLFKAMQRSVQQLGNPGRDSVDAFASAVAELDEQIRADEAAATSAMAEPIAQALKQEKVVAATRSAKSAVAVRVGSGEVVAVLETFLERKWTSVLTVAYTVEEEKPGAVGNATKTMDDLIWSVKPKITVAERKSLIAKLPGLLATLNKWLDVIQWQDADRLQFFAELAECHASIVRAPLDITAERQLEIAVEVAQADAVRRLEKEQQAAAAVVEEVVADPALDSVDTLERGMWLEFVQSDATVRKAKLAWVSPLRTLFIFSVTGRQESFSLSAEKLATGFRVAKISVVQSGSVVSRALASAVNDSSMDAAA